MTLKTNDTISTLISKSVKPRQGAMYTREGKHLDKNSSQWKQVVYITAFGKTVKGKTAYHSETRHERIG